MTNRLTVWLSGVVFATAFSVNAQATEHVLAGEVTVATGAFAALTPVGTPIEGPIEIACTAVISGAAGPGDIVAIDVNVGGFCFTTDFSIDPDTGDPVADPSGCPLGGAGVPITSIDAAALTLGGPTVGGAMDVTAFSPTFGLDIAINFDFDAGTFFATDVPAGALGTVEGAVTLTSAAPPGDLDGDSIADTADNCTCAANPGQEDSNGDDIGSICDADITGPGAVEDCFVNFQDLQAVKTAFFSNPASPNWNADADLDSSGLINFSDLQIVKAQFFGPPGPSAVGCN